MSANFPGTIPSLPHLDAASTTISVGHWQQHEQENREIEAIATKVGTTGDTNPESLTKKMADIGGDVSGLQGDVSGLQGDVLGLQGSVSGIMNLVYPIGSVVTLGVSTNPSTLFGLGTWTQIKGRVIVGKSDSGTFVTNGATGGVETVNLQHSHDNTDSNILPGDYAGISGAGDVGWVPSAGRVAVLSSGGSLSATPMGKFTRLSLSTSQSILQPYIVKYVWERTA